MSKTKPPKERAPIIREQFEHFGAMCRRNLYGRKDPDIAAAAVAITALKCLRSYSREVRLVPSDLQAAIDGFFDGGGYDEDELPMGGYIVTRKKVEAKT
jgi:hypothetical protein